MTGVAWPILLALLAQSADRVKELPTPPPEVSQPGPSTSAPSIPGGNAFGRLQFTLTEPPQNPDRDSIVAVPVPDQKPASKVVCGMVVIRADPEVDPKFVVRAPVDTSAYKIRRIQPQVCAD
jgi:hypothetical protein